VVLASLNTPTTPINDEAEVEPNLQGTHHQNKKQISRSNPKPFLVLFKLVAYKVMKVNSSTLRLLIPQII